MQHVIDPNVGQQSELRIPDREVTTLMPRVYTLKYEVEPLWGRKDVLGARKIFQNKLIVAVNRNPLTTECSNVRFDNSDTKNTIKKDRQGNILILIVFVPVYSILRLHGFRLRCGHVSQ